MVSMGIADDLDTVIAAILREPLDIREARSVPDVENVALKGGGVSLVATFLYADLYDSTILAAEFPSQTTAKVIRAFLGCMSRLVRSCGGEIRSFDGDRVMGVFIGDSKNTSAARCALQMNYVVQQQLAPTLAAAFPVLEQGGYVIEHCVGVATGQVLFVRAGIRGSNDLVAIGVAPNIAAKLSAIRNPPWYTYVTEEVYSALNDDAKFGGRDNTNMWTTESTEMLGRRATLYKSKWTWNPE